MDRVCVSNFNPDNDTIIASAITENNFVQMEAFSLPLKNGWEEEMILHFYVASLVFKEKKHKQLNCKN